MLLTQSNCQLQRDDIETRTHVYAYISPSNHPSPCRHRSRHEHHHHQRHHHHHHRRRRRIIWKLLYGYSSLVICCCCRRLRHRRVSLISNEKNRSKAEINLIASQKKQDFAMDECADSGKCMFTLKPLSIDQSSMYTGDMIKCWDTLPWRREKKQIAFVISRSLPPLRLFFRLSIHILPLVCYSSLSLSSIISKIFNIYIEPAFHCKIAEAR